MSEVPNDFFIKQTLDLADRGAFACFNETIAEALRELLVLRQRYGVEENAYLCLGYAGGCDGSDLVAEPHVAECPARDKDLALRPWLYDVESEA